MQEEKSVRGSIVMLEPGVYQWIAPLQYLKYRPLTSGKYGSWEVTVYDEQEEVLPEKVQKSSQEPNLV